MKISFNEACSKSCSSVEQDLILCESAGFDYIEIRLDMLAKYLQTHTLEDLKAFFAGSRLKPHALNAVYLYEAFMGKGDSLERAEPLLERFMYALSVAREIGAPAIIIVPPLQPNPDGGPYVGDEARITENCVRILRQLSRLAEPYGIQLCFELVGFARSSVRTIALAKKIVEQADCKNVGYVMDSYNIYLYEHTNDFQELQTIDPKKLWAVHINNGDPGEGGGELVDQSQRCFPDHGPLDLANFLHNLKTLGYDGMVSVETFRPEYWAKSPEWVVENAYRSTRDVLSQNGCL